MDTPVDSVIDNPRKRGKDLRPRNAPTPKIDLSQAIQYRYKHLLPFSAIAKHFNCSPQAVQQALEPYEQLFGNPEEIKAYVDNRVPFLTIAENKLLIDIMDADKRQQASLNNTAYAFDKVFQARRLEEGQSTANLDIRTIQVQLNDSLTRLEQQEAELKQALSQDAGPQLTSDEHNSGSKS